VERDLSRFSPQTVAFLGYRADDPGGRQTYGIYLFDGGTATQVVSLTDRFQSQTPENILRDYMRPSYDNDPVSGMTGLDHVPVQNGLLVSKDLRWVILAMAALAVGGFPFVFFSRYDIARVEEERYPFYPRSSQRFQVVGLSFAPDYSRFLFATLSSVNAWNRKVYSLPRDFVAEFENRTSPTFVADFSDLRGPLPVLSLDGNLLLGNSLTTRRNVIGIYDLTAQTETTVQVSARGYFDLHPLPDGRWVAIALGLELPQYELHLFGLDGTLHAVLTPNMLGEFGFWDISVNARTSTVLIVPGSRFGFYTWDPDTGQVQHHAEEFVIGLIAGPEYP
jgi:hypothetical protein